MFLNGALLPVDKFPAWLALVARLLPGTQGIIVLRRVVLDDETLATVWRSGSLGWLALHSAVFFLFGWLVFRVCERHARQRGMLGQY
jgi:ABC-2 type transport system permease protein